MSQEKSHPIRVPSLQIELVGDDDDCDDITSYSDAISMNSDAILCSPANSYSNNVSYLKPPPTTYTYPRRGLIIISPNSTNKR